MGLSNDVIEPVTNLPRSFPFKMRVQCFPEFLWALVVEAKIPSTGASYWTKFYYGLASPSAAGSAGLASPYFDVSAFALTVVVVVVVVEAA